jgi:hypothetical protein
VSEEESAENLDLVTTYRGLDIISYDNPPDDLLAYLMGILHPRQRPRVPGAGFAVQLSLAEQEMHTLPLLDISNAGCAFSMPAGALASRMLPGRMIRSLRICSHDLLVLEDIEAITRHVQLLPSRYDAPPQYRVGVAFLPKQAVEVGSMDMPVTEPQRIRAILLDRRSQASLVLRRFDDDLHDYCLFKLEFNAQDRCLVMTVDANCTFRRGDVVRGIFEMSGDTFSFVTSVLEISRAQTETIAIMGIPRVLRVAKRRRAVRFRPRHENPVHVDIASPFAKRTGIGLRPVLDLTSHGLCFAIQDDLDIFPVGTVLPSFTLHFPDGHQAQCQGKVRSISRVGGVLRCGVEIEPTSSLAQDRLADAIVHAGQPDIQDVRSTPSEEVWGFLERSGFIYPEKRRGLDIDAVRSTMTRLTEGPNDVFKGTLFVRGETIHAHISAVRLYERTWMLQHLAARSSIKQPISFARLINLALLEYLEQKSDIEWIRVTYRPENKAPARLFRGLAARVSRPELSRVRIMNCMRSSLRDTDIPCAPGVVVRPPGGNDITFIESYMLTHRDTFATQQEDLSHNELHLEGIAARYRRIGLERRREILVLTHQDRIAGFALLEISSLGLNLSEITNTFRVFLLPDAAPELAAPLIRAARARYLALGRSHVIALVDDGLVRAFESLGFEHFKRYALWTWHRSLYRQFHDYLLGESR